jgi:hypothetical protein
MNIIEPFTRMHSWTIYTFPRDFPTTRFVMREFILTGEGVAPTESFWTADTIEELHAKIPPGAERFNRHPNDEPQIVEWWLE